jgi:hypothetical protein
LASSKPSQDEVEDDAARDAARDLRLSTFGGDSWDRDIEKAFLLGVEFGRKQRRTTPAADVVE